MADACIGVTTVTRTGSMHVRAWRVPSHFAAKFAAALTAGFGDPDEMISDLETMEAGGKRAADEGAALFLVPGDEGGSDG